jgi:hypothetical protein
MAKAPLCIKVTKFSLPFPFDRHLSGYLKWSMDDVRKVFLYECCIYKSYLIFKLCGEINYSHVRNLTIRRSFHRKPLSDHVPSRFNPFRRFSIQVILTNGFFLPPPKRNLTKILYNFPISLKQADLQGKHILPLLNQLFY